MTGFLASPAPVEAAAAALVRNVDEPTRVPYFRSEQPTCPFENQCTLTLPAVPAGKRLRLTLVEGIFYFAGAGQNAFVSVDLADTAHALFAFPITAFNAAYHGNLLSFNQPVDVFFEAGQVVILEVGTPFTTPFFNDSRNRLTVSGYLVDLLP